MTGYGSRNERGLTGLSGKIIFIWQVTEGDPASLLRWMSMISICSESPPVLLLWPTQGRANEQLLNHALDVTAIIRGLDGTAGLAEIL